MSMKKRIADIYTRFRVDGAKQAGQEMQSVGAAAAKASKAAGSLSGTGAAQIAGAAGAAAGQLDEVRESALAAKKAIAEIGNVKVNGRGLDLGLKASGKDAAASASAFQAAYSDTQRRVSATSLAGVDTSKIAPNVDRGVLERALKAARQAAGEGMPIDVYVDPASLVRVEKDVLRALDDVTPNVDFSNVDKGALKRAGAAMTKALASGMKLDSFIDAQTAVAFSGEQLEELARTGYGTGEALEDVADEAKKADRAINKIDDRPIRDVRDQTLASNRGFRTLRTGAEATVRSLRSVGSAGAAMGVTLSTALQKSTGLLKGLAAGAAGLAASKGLTIGGAGAFGLSAARGQVERYKTTRNISALTGMSPQETDFWERFGANVGLEGTDLGQVFSGFVAARRDVEKDPESDVGRIFADLKLGGKGEPRTRGIEGLLPTLKDADGNAIASRSASMFSSIYDDAEKATDAVQGTNAAFLELLLSLRGLDPQKRAGYLTQIFGEDDALKVAELAQLVGQQGGIAGAMRMMAARGDLISDRELGQVRRFQRVSLQLSNTWDGFKRRLFAAIEPLLTRYAVVFDNMVRILGPSVIQNLFVTPLERGHSVFQRLAKSFTEISKSTNGFRSLRGQLSNTYTVLHNIVFLAYEFAKVFGRVFLLGAGGRSIESEYVSILNAIQGRLDYLRAWLHRDGEAAALRAQAMIGGLISVAGATIEAIRNIAQAIDQMLTARGIDWRAFLAPENLASEAKKAADLAGAVFRDLGRLLTGQTGFLETPLARWLVELVDQAKVALADVATVVQSAFARAFEGARRRVESFLAYFQTSFAEFGQAMSGGLAIEDMSTRLGQLMAVLGHVVDYLVRLSTAFRDVVVEGKKAPQGFEWLETVAGIAERLGGAITNVFNAIKSVTQPLDEILRKMGLWDTATIALAGLIVGKIAAAFGTTVVGAIGSAILAAKKLMGILGLGSAGGAAAGAAAASGTAAGAAGAGATGGILAGVTAIGVALGKTLLRFTPIVGALAGITAGFYAVLQQADRLMPFIDRLGGALGLKTKADVETDVAGIRAQMDADYARFGGKPGNGILRQPVAGGVATADAYQLPQDMRRFLAEYGRQVEPNARPTNVVNLEIGGQPLGSLSATDDQIASLTTSLQRARARRFG